MTNATKKQNRILLGTLVLLCAALITLELAVRYLEDYVIGDKYFRTDHPGQNLERARGQLRLFRDMMLHMDEMKKIIEECL